MPAPTLPIPDPKAVVAQAIMELAACYPDDPDIKAIVNAGASATCAGSHDILALFALAAAKAACLAKNPDPSCCEADPFIVNNLIVNHNATIVGNLTVLGGATIGGDMLFGANVCAGGLPDFGLTHTVGQRIVVLSGAGCFNTIPKTDLDPKSLVLPGSLTVALDSFINGSMSVGAGVSVVEEVAIGLNLFVGGGICMTSLPETPAFTADCRVLVVKSGCLYTLPPGICCVDSPPPDPDPPVPPTPPPPIVCPLQNIPAIPIGLIPPGARADRQLPLYDGRYAITLPGSWSVLDDIPHGPLTETGLPPNVHMNVMGEGTPAVRIPGNAYYHFQTNTWQNTPFFNLYYEIHFWDRGVTVWFHYWNNDNPVSIHNPINEVFVPEGWLDTYTGEPCPLT